jgi:RNA polymerase sigma-70 factor (ECF subfamily)
MSNAEFSLLLTENADFLKPFAIGLTKDQMTAQDLFQETMYRAFYNKDKYNVGTNIKAWLYTIMRNVFINDYRKKNKLGVLYDITDQQSLIDQSTHKAHNQALHNLRYQEIQKYIQELPELFKTPFCLYVDGYKYNEIAEALNEPLGTIKSRIHFARKILKQKIEK